MRAVMLLSIAGLLITDAAPTQTAVRYPLVLTLDAHVTSGVTTITSKVTIRLDGPMSDDARARVTDALRYGGYANFVTTLRPVPAVGSVETQSAKVAIRYTREEQDGTGSRLVLIADRPLFFLGGDPAKSRVGFDLTMIDLRFDAQGGISGQMAGAARVRPAPDGGVLLDTFAEEPVQLKGLVGTP